MQIVLKEINADVQRFGVSGGTQDALVLVPGHPKATVFLQSDHTGGEITIDLNDAETEAFNQLQHMISQRLRHTFYEETRPDM